jgi:hypothetical protein
MKFGKSHRLLVGPHTGMMDEHGLLRQADPGAGIAKAAGVTVGDLHDMRIKAELGPINGGAVDAYRESSVRDGSMFKAVRFKSPKKLPAIVTRGRLTWLAFDVGRAYNATTDAGRRWLIRTLAIR